jgi:ribosome-binding factor A
VSRRSERVAEQVRGEVARILREEATDPRLRLLTLTRVEVTADLSLARIYWSHLEAREPEDLAVVAGAVERAGGFVRHRLASVLPLRRAPALHFHLDPSMIEGGRTLAVLAELRGGPEE